MTGELQWIDSRIGLQYFAAAGLVFYWPDAPFFVDGIRYDVRSGSPSHKRHMVELISDRRDLGIAAELSRPPTEHELDLYVRTGSLNRRTA